MTFLFRKEQILSLQNPSFRWLYLSQAINLLGDALSWTGLALLAHQIAGEKASLVLSLLLTIRVVVFVLVAPYTGVLADRLDRKKIMLLSHLFRMLLVALLPFAYAAWQMYAFVFVFSIFSALFTPTFKASVVQVFHGSSLYTQAISLSSATYLLLGILGPGLAGGMAALFNVSLIFWVDAFTFLLSSLCIFMVPLHLKMQCPKSEKRDFWKDVRSGTSLLFGNALTRKALFMQLVCAIVGGQVLVNSIYHVKESLSLDDSHYGWLMSLMGLGSVLGALFVGQLKNSDQRLTMSIWGALLSIVFVAFANQFSFYMLLFAWAGIGISESLVNIPTDTLIADQTPKDKQGRVYGTHFSWSHLWWAFAYPLAGLSVRLFPENYFLTGSLLAFALWLSFSFFRKNKNNKS